MRGETDFARVAALMGDPARAAMLEVLLDGRAMPAGELAQTAGVKPPAASVHLAKLVDGGLLTVATQGRHRYFHLASSAVAHAIEAIADISPHYPVRTLRQSLLAQQLAYVRTCYDHLAGRVAVRIVDALEERGDLERIEGGVAITAGGSAFFARMGLDTDELCGRERAFSKTCNDWTQRRPHLSGKLGQAFFHRMLDADYFRKGDRPRTLVITPEGSRAFETLFGFDPQTLR